MHLQEIDGSEFFLTQKSVVGFWNGKLNSAGGICKARDKRADEKRFREGQNEPNKEDKMLFLLLMAYVIWRIK